MAISKSTILTEVNNRTARSETDIDTILRAVLLDLTLDIPALKETAYTTTTAGQAEYSLSSFPEDIRSIEVAKIDDNTPLKRLNSFKDYLALIADQTSADYDEPEYYIVYNNSIYLYPTPDDSYTLYVYGTCLELDEDEIDLPDVYQEAIIEGCCWKLYESKGLGTHPSAQAHLQNYLLLKEQLISYEIKKQGSGEVTYTDI